MWSTYLSFFQAIIVFIELRIGYLCTKESEYSKRRAISLISSRSWLVFDGQLYSYPEKN